MKKLDEKEIIRIFAERLDIKELDDVAVLDKKNIVAKSDMLVGSTDVPDRMGPWQVARKSIVSCVSDMAAKGIRPHAAVISLGLPKNSTRPYVEGLAEGFARASKEFAVRIVGGDTNEANDLVIDCTILGFANGKVPPRTGAKPGNLVVVSGLFGLPAAGLELLMRSAASKGAFRREAIDSVLEPLPRTRFGLSLAKFFSSSIDSSDGLATSLYELAAGSGVDIFVDRVPAAEGIEEFALENKLDLNELIFHGGEEYEIVATIPKSRLRMAEAAARRAKLNMNIIGQVSKGRGRVYVGNKLLANRGYLHFDRR